MNVEEALVT